MFPQVSHQAKSSASAHTDILLTQESVPLLHPRYFFYLQICVFSVLRQGRGAAPFPTPALKVGEAYGP